MMKIFVCEDREGNIHIVDDVKNCPGNLNLLRFYEMTFPGKHNIVINLNVNKNIVEVFPEDEEEEILLSTSTGMNLNDCDNCGKEAELYHNERTGLAFCEFCDMEDERMHENVV
jgi:hypothetical protein